MQTWLKESGAVGLDDFEIAKFEGTGRGVKGRRHFREGEKILTIPSKAIWTINSVYEDPIVGQIIRDLQPSLSIEDAFAVYILFVKSGDTGYEGQRSHIALLPASYSSSIFFTSEELEVCAGSSLHTLTVQLKQRIQDDYNDLNLRLFEQHPTLFPLHNFTLVEVGILKYTISVDI